MDAKAIFRLLKTAGTRWWGDNTFQLGAALAYYTIFSLAPVVLIALSVAGLFFEKTTVQAELLRDINNTVGSRVGQAIESIAHYTQDTGTGALATVIGVVVLFFGATSVFAQLQDALNTIWGVKPKEGIGWLKTIKSRFWSFAIVLGIGFLLLVSLILSAVLAGIARFLTPSALPGGAWLWQSLNGLVSFGLITWLFALIYKLLPDAKVEWGDVWVGAAVTALLFVVGKYLIGLYLGRSSWISAYGAAGSLVVVLLWVYYASQIFLFGAEFTYVYANQSGKPLVPKEDAQAVKVEGSVRPESSPPPAQPSLTTPSQGGFHFLQSGWAVAHRLPWHWEAIRTHYGFLPAVLSVLAGVLALVTAAVDEVMQQEGGAELTWMDAPRPEGARYLLSTVAGSMITVAAVVFFLTLVPLSLASNRFGPRLFRNFLNDRGNQLVWGLFAATFVYCLLVLRTVRDAFVPHLSITVATLLALVDLGVLIYFFYHVAHSLQAPEVIANSARELHAVIDRVFPEKLGDGQPTVDGKGHSEDQPGEDCEWGAHPVLAMAEGYVQAIDKDRLMKVASEQDLRIRITRHTGHFVGKGSSLALVGVNHPLDTHLAGQIRDAFTVSAQQTAISNVESAIEQLVEMAVRVLSPEATDPSTAMRCLDRLGSALCDLAGRKLPSEYQRDEAGQVRVIAYPVSFPDLADMALRPIRRAGRSNPALLLHLLEVIAAVLPHTRREGDRGSLMRQALMTKIAGATLPEETDRREIEERYHTILAMVQGSQRCPPCAMTLARPACTPTDGTGLGP
jgi:YihY family inner membrane protein